LLADQVFQVTTGVNAPAKKGMDYYLDYTIELGAGNVTSQSLRKVHKKDLAVQSKLE